MKILHVVGQLDRAWGGLSEFVAQVAGKQAAQGHYVSILTAKPRDDHPQCDIGIAKRSTFEARNLRPQIEAADIVHVHGLWLPMYHTVLKVAERTHTPSVLSPHGMLEPAALQFSKWRKRLAWLAFQRSSMHSAKLLHATASAERETMRRWGLKQAIVEVPPGVDVPELEVDRRKSSAGPRTAVYLGRLHPIKGIDLLVDAWLRVCPQNWRLLVVGPDEAGIQDRLERTIANSSAKVDIIWLGPVFDGRKLQILQESDLVIVPSRSENFALTVIEGLAYRCPVLTTTGTPWKCLADMNIGWICEPNAGSLTTTLTDAIGASTEKMEHMGMCGRQWVREKFQWERGAATLIQAYSWICGKGSICPEIDVGATSHLAADSIATASQA